MDLKFKLNGNNNEVDLSKFKGKKVFMMVRRLNKSP